MKSQNERGVLTPEIQEVARQFLGEEIKQTELRLYPYIDYCWKNGGRIDYEKLTADEALIFEFRVTQGYMIFDGYNLAPTRDFYNYVQNILALGYVIFGGENNEN